MTADEETLRRRYRELTDLMPLAIAIAGLPQSEPPINFSADQMEVRTHTLQLAYKLARQMARDVVGGN